MVLHHPSNCEPPCSPPQDSAVHALQLLHMRTDGGQERRRQATLKRRNERTLNAAESNWVSRLDGALMNSSPDSGSLWGSAMACAGPRIVERKVLQLSGTSCWRPLRQRSLSILVWSAGALTTPPMKQLESSPFPTEAALLHAGHSVKLRKRIPASSSGTLAPWQ